MRNNSFDSMLVEAGPPPMLLSDGNYLFIYNSARQNASSPDHFEYNIGWLIINGSNPLHILQRSDTPLLSPQLGWEVSLLLLHTLSSPPPPSTLLLTLSCFTFVNVVVGGCTSVFESYSQCCVLWGNAWGFWKGFFRHLLWYHLSLLSFVISLSLTIIY